MMDENCQAEAWFSTVFANTKPDTIQTQQIIASISLLDKDQKQHSNVLEELLLQELSASIATSGNGALVCLSKMYETTSALKAKIDSSLLDEVYYFILSYGGMIAIMPALVPHPQSIIDEGPKYIIRMLEEGKILFSYLSQIINHYNNPTMDSEVLDEFIDTILAGLMGRIKQFNLLSPFLATIDVLESLIKIKPFALHLTKSKLWLPNNFLSSSPPNASLIESQVFLGPFMAISISPNLQEIVSLLPSPLQNASFPDSSNMLTIGQLDSINYTLQSALHLVQSKLHLILYSLIKQGNGKDDIVHWFAQIGRANINRAKMQVDPATVSSDGFIANCFAVLLKFSHPFLTSFTASLGKIDNSFLFRSDNLLIDLGETTRLNSPPDAFQSFLSEKSFQAGQFNFVTECFFLTLQFFRLSLIRLVNVYENLLKAHHESLQAIQDLGQTSPTSNPLAHVMERNLKARFERIRNLRIATEVVLRDAELVYGSFQLVAFTMNWMTLLSESDPQLFIHLPEFIVENVAEWCLYLARYNLEFWRERVRQDMTSLDSIINFIIKFLASPSHIKNPYLRSKFVELLHAWTTEPELLTIFEAYPSMIKRLTTSLIKFYIEVESTGASTQFYDKFSIRYHISKIIKATWSMKSHQDSLIQYSQNEIEEFVRFVNLLVNDVTYLLDESMTKLVEIHNQQLGSKAIPGNGEGNSEPPSTENHGRSENNQDRNNNLRMLERQCQSCIQLGFQTLHMLQYLTTAITEPFLRPEVVDRLVGMLDLNLVLLVGPKCSSLKVQNAADKFQFYPKEWVAEIVQIFLNLGKFSEFVRAVARDRRSFDPTTFEKAIGVLVRTNTMGTLDTDRFAILIKSIESTIAEENLRDMELGDDIPDEFLDPLMFTIMENPVKLPTSNITVDRGTIVAHLLNDPHDPFNRKPLELSEIVPDEQLKIRIQEFLRQKRS